MAFTAADATEVGVVDGEARWTQHDLYRGGPLVCEIDDGLCKGEAESACVLGMEGLNVTLDRKGIDYQGDLVTFAAVGGKMRAEVFLPSGYGMQDIVGEQSSTDSIGFGVKQLQCCGLELWGRVVSGEARSYEGCRLAVAISWDVADLRCAPAGVEELLQGFGARTPDPLDKIVFPLDVTLLGC
jgi:hypothetical protein